MKYTLRPANQSDSSKIRSLIHQVKINPTNLDWRRFIVAVNSMGEIIGCGQVKSHSDGSLELASIAVAVDYRDQGIATAIIEHLLNIYPKPLYLTCRSGLEPFYQSFGFNSVSAKEMPPYFRRIHALTEVAMKIIDRKEKLLVMLHHP